MTTNVSFEERVRGCLFGGAVGDAFGYPIEFLSHRSIVAEFGEEGLQEPVPDSRGGSLLVSDDTQMTMFTLEGLLLAVGESEEERLQSIRLAYLDWLDTQRGGPATGLRHAPGAQLPLSGRLPGSLVMQPVMRHPRAPGTTCLSALRAGGRGTPGEPINSSKGCGGVMRVAPIGLLPDLSPAQAFALAARTAALTHGHPSGYLSAGSLAAMVRLLLEGASLRAAAATTLALLETWPGHEETTAALESALSLATEADPGARLVPARLGEGWVGEEALAIAVWAALTGSTFPAVLRLAANHSGDSDSTASVAGQLWGVEHGLAGLPEDWVQRLDVYAELQHLADRFLIAGSRA